MDTCTPSPSGPGVDTGLATLEATIDARLEQLARREQLRALVRTVSVACLPVAAAIATALAVAW